MPKQKRWTNQCACRHYMPDGYKRCDICLLQEYDLYHKQKYDALDHYSYFPLYPEEDVLKALRKIEAEWEATVEEVISDGDRLADVLKARRELQAKAKGS